MSSVTVTRSVVSFDGTEIRYDIRDAASRATIVVLPGFWRDRRHPAMDRFAGLLHGAGWRVAVVDMRGHGESGGEFGFNLHEHRDIDAVVRDLLASSGTTESVTLVGFSHGGAVAISTAARHQLPIASLLLISPVADFGMIAPRLNPLTIHRHLAFGQVLRRPRFAWRTWRTAKLRAVDDVPDVHAPICFVHVKDDWLIGHRHSLSLFEAANEPKQIHVLDVEGRYHADRIFASAAAAIEPVVLGFLAQHTPK